VSHLRQQLAQSRFTRGALILLIAEVVATTVFLFQQPETRAQVAEWTIASKSTVFEHGRVWTLLTGALIEPDFIQLVLSGLMLWMFLPTLERFWGTARFLRFAAITAVAGALGGSLVGLALDRDVLIPGLSPFIMGSIVAYGIVYGRQQVLFSFYIKMTGRQMMFGFLAVFGLMILLTQRWELGGAYVASIGATVVMTSKRWSPGLAWRKWRIARARAKLSVLEGGQKKPRAKDEAKYLN
jgi:membrane associated rhomboid family serine protease